MRLCLFIALLGLASFPAMAEPVLTLQLPEQRLHPGETYTLYAVLSGVEEGRAIALLPAPPAQAPRVDWGTLAVEAVESSAGQLRLRVELGPSQTGDFTIPAIPARLVEVPTDAPLVGETLDIGNAITVATEPAEVVVTEDRSGPIAAGGAVVVLAGLAGAVVVWLRRRPRAPQGPRQDPVEAARDHVHAARRHRLDGDFYRFYQSLAAAARTAGTPASLALAPRMDERAQQVGYQGVRPTEDELDGAVKDIERALTPRPEE